MKMARMRIIPMQSFGDLILRRGKLRRSFLNLGLTALFKSGRGDQDLQSGVGQKSSFKEPTMNILETIMGKILPKQAQAQQQTPTQQPATAQPSPLKTNDMAAPSPVMSEVDVEKVLQAMENKGSQPLDWRHSIVDLLKMLGMESDLASRKQLAKELNYTGDMNDSAKMNIWLHQQVMQKLEANGGKIPESMKH
jgi:hypothetical protein